MGRHSKHCLTFFPSHVSHSFQRTLTIIGIVCVAMQLVSASPVGAADGANHDPPPADYCASLNGSNWTDSDGHAIHFGDSTVVYIGPQGTYGKTRYRCSDNTITYSNSGQDVHAQIANDGMTAIVGPAGLNHVWQLVSWPTDCSLDGLTIHNGSSINAYRYPFVSQGQKCIRETRTCTNGTLSGDDSYIRATCAVIPPNQTPVTVATLVASVLLIGWLVRRHFGKAA